MTAHETSSRSQRVFTGEHLREIAFPLGGIGTGTVRLGGRGQLRDWEIFNRPGKGKDLPYTFFAIYAEAEGEAGVARVLESRLLPPYQRAVPACRPDACRACRAYRRRHSGANTPLRGSTLRTMHCPSRSVWKRYNPFIPMNAVNSGLPLAWFRWTLTNTTDKPVQATIAFSLLNAVGYDGQDSLSNRSTRTVRAEPERVA